jgi:hypothetical protein
MLNGNASIPESTILHTISIIGEIVDFIPPARLEGAFDQLVSGGTSLI